MAVQSFSPIEEKERDRFFLTFRLPASSEGKEHLKSEIDSAKTKQENRRFVVSKAFAESWKCRAEILNFLKPSKLRFFWKLVCLINLTPDASVYVFVRQGQMLGCSSLLNGGGLKSAETRFSRCFCVPQTWWRVSKTFGKRQSPSKLQLCPFSKANWIFPLTLVSMTVFYKGKTCLTSKETTSKFFYARLCAVFFQFQSLQ